MCDFFIKSVIFHINSFTHASLLCYSENGILVYVWTHYKVKYWLYIVIVTLRKSQRFYMKVAKIIKTWISFLLTFLGCPKSRWLESTHTRTLYPLDSGWSSCYHGVQWHGPFTSHGPLTPTYPMSVFLMQCSCQPKFHVRDNKVLAYYQVWKETANKC